MTSSGRGAAALLAWAVGVASDASRRRADTSNANRSNGSAPGASQAFDFCLVFIGAAIKEHPVGEKILERVLERKDGSR
jgi:hypothetical protein